MPVIPWSEYRPDVSDYKGQHTQRLVNVLPRGDGYGPFYNISALTSALPDTCRGYHVAFDDDGSVKIFAGTVDNLYLLDNSDYTWDEVSKTSDTYSVPTDDQWQFETFGVHVIAVNANTVPQIYTMGSSSAFANLGGSPPQARYVTVVNEFLVLSGLLSNPYRIAWSARSDVTGWTAGTNESDVQDFVDGGIVRGVAGGEFGVIFQDNAIRRMNYAPGSPIIFSIDRLAEDKGLEAPLSIVRSGERTLFLSQSGFHQITADGAIAHIGREKFDRTFFEDWDSAEPRVMIGSNDPQSTRVFWAYKSVNGTNNQFDKIIVYDWLLDRACIIEGISGHFITSFAQPGVTLEGLDALGFTLDTLPASLDSFPANFGIEISVCDTSNKLGFFRGSTLEAILETAEQGGDSNRSFISGARPVTDADDVRGQVSSRQRLADTPSWSTENSLETIGIIPHRVDTRYFRFRNRIPAGTEWEFSIGVEPMVKPTGAR